MTIMEEFEQIKKDTARLQEMVDEDYSKTHSIPLSDRAIEIMDEVGITMKDIIAPGGYKKCLECKQEPHVPGMWVCEKCYDKRKK